MSKQACIIISDLHVMNSNNDNRKNYNSEIVLVINKIKEVLAKYKSEGYAVKLLFLGDIIDRSYKDIFKAIWIYSIFYYLKNNADGCYCVLGNHEFSFYTNNPFWSFVNKIESSKINKVVSKTWAPQGIFPVIRVVDHLEIGDTVFHFNHHPTPCNKPIAGKVNIGLFHKAFAPKGVITEMQNNYKLDIWEDSIEKVNDDSTVFEGYNYAFLGHMHKMYGKYYYKNDNTGWETYLYYLGSLGRPNQTEVQNSFLERNLPTVIIEDDKFQRVEDNLFNLKSREDCVIEKVVEQRKEVYEEKKAKQVFTKTVSLQDNPMEAVREVLAQAPGVLRRFEEYQETDTLIYEHELENRLEELEWN